MKFSFKLVAAALVLGLSAGGAQASSKHNGQAKQAKQAKTSKQSKQSDVPSTEQCGCEGKVSGLTMRWDSSFPSDIYVVQKDGAEVFSGWVLDGDEFSFSGVDKKGTLSPWIDIYYGGVFAGRLHTSCSIEIGPGTFLADQNTDQSTTTRGFRVIDGSSRHFSELCATGPIPPPPSSGNL